MPVSDIVNSPEATKDQDEGKPTDLGSHVRSLMQNWEDTRNTNYERAWSQYERLWRQIWSAQDKQRKSERSRYVSPALSHAVESIVAEIEEAIFATGRFFDIDPLMAPESEVDMQQLRDLLYDDMLRADIKSAISEIILNGAIYGTGIGKIIVEATQDRYITPKPVNGLPEVVEAGLSGDEQVIVRLVPVSPKEFVIDNASKNIPDALGMGHITIVPKHIIDKRIRDGIYDDVEVEDYEMSLDDDVTGEVRGLMKGHIKVWEYHGLVPVDMLARYVLGEDYDEVVTDPAEIEDEDDLVEAIVTIANEGTLLRAIPNPNTLQDRNFVAFQFDTIPNRFYGRGVCEKGYNSQMALDHEGRGRQDGMSLAIHPMLGVDANMMPKGADVRVRPGRTILTQGDPAAALKPLNFGQIGTDTFSQSADLERMLAKGTGALDDNAINTNGAKTGAVGMAISGAIKRTQRTLSNVERNLIDPAVHKFAYRYMQFAPDRYPIVEDPKFKVATTQGIMAKEWEVTQLGNMLKTVSPDSPAYWMLLKGIFQNSSIKNREEFDTVISGQLEAALNPQPSPMEVAQMEAQQAKLRIDHARARAELLRIEMAAQGLETDNMKKTSEAILNLAKAEAEEAGTNIQQYQAILTRIKAGLDMNIQKADRQTPEVPNVQ